jgi:S-DNA-T family DNA segregation ATPase FtsK/SpoIIIE
LHLSWSLKLAAKSTKKDNTDNSAHPLRKEIRGLVFLLLAIFLCTSLLSYVHDDKLFWDAKESFWTLPFWKEGFHNFFQSEHQNLFGTIGAHLAGGLLDILGFSAFWLVAILVVMTLLSFRGQPLSSAVKSIVAAVALPISSSGILNLFWPDKVVFKGGSMTAGGLIGLYLSGLTESFLNNVGALVLLSAIFIISFMLITHLSLGWLFSRTGIWILVAFRHMGETIRKKRERRKRARKTMAAKAKRKSKPKVRIITPKPEPIRKPKQRQFDFMDDTGEFKLPSLDFLRDPPERKDIEIQHESLEMNARRVEKKLEDFGVHGEVKEILPGPVITMYEFKPAPGVKISKVAGLSDDLALTLRAPSIRIVAPIPGKAAIGIEIPNNQRTPVFLKEVLSDDTYMASKLKLPIALGKDITGSPMITDLTRMPHLLMAGATGTGKSVCINTIINSILFKSSPDKTKLLMIDPKRIELSAYQDIPHLLHPVVTQPKDATKALKWAVEEMERRYMLLSDRGARNIDTYNRKIVKDTKPDTEDSSQGVDRPLPYIVIIIDELADLMMVSSKEVEEAITRLAQMARAAGIHLILATQRPSVDVLTGIIKANFPTRISFQVSSKVDSRTILDCIGAEHLLGEGDMLFLPPGVARLTRIHGAYVSDEEVKTVTDFLKKQKKPDYDTTILSNIASDEDSDAEEIELDEKYEEAVGVVLRTGQASISMLQRKLRVGYNRAARMIEAMENEGIVGPSDGVRARDVYGRRGA